MTKDELAQLITLAASTFYTRDWFQRVPDQMLKRCRDLNTGVLSTTALAAIFGVTPYRIEQMLGDDRPKVRGTLNPSHLSILAYALSNKKLPAERVKALVSEGTSIGMIARLTKISERTLQRRMQ